MNGFSERGLDEGHFSESKGLSVVKAFDAFPKTKRTYLTQTRSGSGIFTIALVLVCLILTGTEIVRWFNGTTTHAFSVEGGIGHDMQINVDIIVAMHCTDLHVNVQDASGDRVIASERLNRHPTLWQLWDEDLHALRNKVPPWLLHQWEQYGHADDVHDFIRAAAMDKRFRPTPKLRIPENEADACRIFGIVEGNKVQGDLHITARGHGYMEMGEHLDHHRFNFSHLVNELSFGPHIPTLHNPLDKTKSTTDINFYKYQYYLSIVPTIYTTDTDTIADLQDTAPPTLDDPRHHDSLQIRDFKPFAQTIYTNQYAATEQSHTVDERTGAVPGIFLKYDIEPILLIVAEEWGGMLGMAIRCVNVISGILVAGGWIVAMMDWAVEVWGRRRRRAGLAGMLNVDSHHD